MNYNEFPLSIKRGKEAGRGGGDRWREGKTGTVVTRKIKIMIMIFDNNEQTLFNQ